jgi:hypothetical protein
MDCRTYLSVYLAVDVMNKEKLSCLFARLKRMYLGYPSKVSTFIRKPLLDRPACGVMRPTQVWKLCLVPKGRAIVVQRLSGFTGERGMCPEGTPEIRLNLQVSLRDAKPF